MMVKCKCHGFSIDRDTAFKVTRLDKNGKKLNTYYCSREIYEEIFLERENRDLIAKTIKEILINVEYSLFKPQVLRMLEVYSSKDMLDYLEHRKDRLSAYINRKEFVSNQAKANYFLAVFRNELKDWTDSKQEIVEAYGFEFGPTKYKPRKRKPPLEEYEDGDDEI